MCLLKNYIKYMMYIRTVYRYSSGHQINIAQHKTAFHHIPFSLFFNFFFFFCKMTSNIRWESSRLSDSISLCHKIHSSCLFTTLLSENQYNFFLLLSFILALFLIYLILLIWHIFQISFTFQLMKLKLNHQFYVLSILLRYLKCLFDD